MLRAPTVPHMVLHIYSLSRSILQSITGADLIGAYRSANPREIVSYGVAQDISTSTYFPTCFSFCFPKRKSREVEPYKTRGKTIFVEMLHWYWKFSKTKILSLVSCILFRFYQRFSSNTERLLKIIFNIIFIIFLFYLLSARFCYIIVKFYIIYLYKFINFILLILCYYFLLYYLLY